MNIDKMAAIYGACEGAFMARDVAISAADEAGLKYQVNGNALVEVERAVVTALAKAVPANMREHSIRNLILIRVALAERYEDAVPDNFVAAVALIETGSQP